MSLDRSMRAAVAAAVVAAAAAAAMAPAVAGLRSEPTRCGDFTCAQHQYCSGSTDTCQNCSRICHQDTHMSHNYNQAICQRDCQDYLHDMLYQRKNDDVKVAAVMRRLEGDLHRLTIIVIVMFSLFIVCFIGLAIYACSSYRKACRRRKTTDLESNSIELKKIAANGLGAPPAGPPVISPKSSTVPQYAVGGRPSLSFAFKQGDEDKQRIRSRHPSEDTCPGDYSGVYDNPAMVVTPPPGASGGATARPLSASGSTLYSRDSYRPVGSAASSNGRTESTRLPREVDITDMSPARTVEAM